MGTDDNTANKIIEYFQNKDYDISLKLIAEYGLYTPIDIYGNSFAHYCAANNFPEAFALASKGDKGLSAPGIEGLTPLMLAADYENLEVLQILLDLDADVNKTDEDGFGAIYYAAAGRSFARTHEPRPLVDSRFHHWRGWRESSSKITDDDQTYQDKKIDGFKNGNNEQTQLNIVTLLLEKGACEHIGSMIPMPSQGKRPESELSVAIKAGNDECAKKLVEAGWNINACDGTGTPPLCAAARSNDYSMVKYLLDAGAKTDIADIFDQTPLALALYRERMDIANLLLEHTKDLSNDKLCLVRALRVDFAGYALLGGVGFAPLPLSECPIEIIQEMIRKGADIEQRDDEGSTPLIWAAADDNYPAVKALIELGADVNAKDDRGFNVIDNVLQTTQNWELTYPRVEVIKLLVDAGAEINISTNGLGTPLNQAFNIADMDLIRYLTECGALLDGKSLPSNEFAINYAALCAMCNLPGTLKQFIPFLEEGSNTAIGELPDGDSIMDGCTLLYLAVLAQDNKCIDILIEAGADVNLCNKIDSKCEYAGHTPLMGAALHHNFDISRKLIEHGANPWKQTHLGLTATDLIRDYYAIDNPTDYLFDLMRYLSPYSYSKDRIICKLLCKQNDLLNSPLLERNDFSYGEISAEVQELANVAIVAKRYGDLETAEGYYYEAFQNLNHFDGKFIWGWCKIKILAKDWESLLRLQEYYFNIMLAWNKLADREGIDYKYCIPFTSNGSHIKYEEYDPTKLYTYKGMPIEFGDRKDLAVKQFADYGGSQYWKDNYDLSDTEWAEFQQVFSRNKIEQDTPKEPSAPKAPAAPIKQAESKVSTTPTKQTNTAADDNTAVFKTALCIFLGSCLGIAILLSALLSSCNTARAAAPNLEFPNQYIELKPKNGKLTKTTSVDFLTETDSNCTVTYSITDKDPKAGKKIRIAPDKTYYIVEKGLKKGTYAFIVKATSTSNDTQKATSKTAQIEVIIKQ